MNIPTPHFLLMADAARSARRADWRFVLQSADGSAKIEVQDEEPDVFGERLELLAVVRGLEALDQPSRVTLVTSSSYVHRGFQFGLREWRDSQWQWERHGEMVPVKNHDLWQRVDRAMSFHRIDCRTVRVDGPHLNSAEAVDHDRPPLQIHSRRLHVQPTRNRRRRFIIGCLRWVRDAAERWQYRLAQCGTPLAPSPWME